jgi:glycosyltransferase involved in cell wall biosynthesis
MRIAFDLRRIGNPGIGRYMKCLVEAILKQETDNEYLLLVPSDASDIIQSNSANVRRVVARSSYYSFREQIELPQILRTHKVDLLHSPHFLLPLSRPCPAVVTIHDVIYMACPEDLESKLGRLYYRAMMHASARLAVRIITDSIFSKNEIVRYLHVDPAKITVIYPAVDPGFRQISDAVAREAVFSKHGIGGDYIFYTGIYKARKNHAGLLKSFKRFLEFGGNGQLVIAGPLNEGERRLRTLAEELRISKQVIFTGFVDDAELCALYSAARVYACPSLYEGFGFTVLEAMACGTPVVCSEAASLPEVAGDAALRANANDAHAFGEALYQVFTDDDLRREMIGHGRQNLRRFSWEQAAKQCLQTYDEAVGGTISATSPLRERSLSH